MPESRLLRCIENHMLVAEDPTLASLTPGLLTGICPFIRMLVP